VLDGDFPGGIAALREALQARPNHAETTKALGLALAKGRHTQEALDVLHRYATREAADIEIFCVIGELCLEQRDYRGMAAALRRCLELDPDAVHPSGVRARGLIKKAEKQLKVATAQ